MTQFIENALTLKKLLWKEKQILIFLSAKLLCFFEYNYRKSVNSTKLDKEDSSAFFASAHFFYLETLAQCKSSIHPIFSTEHFQNRGVLKTCLPLYPSKQASPALNWIQFKNVLTKKLTCLLIQTFLEWTLYYNIAVVFQTK